MALRKISILIVLLLFFVLFISCENAPSSTSTIDVGTDTENGDSEATHSTLSFRITWKDYSGRGEAIQKIVDSYNGSGKAISMVNGNEDRAAIEALLKSGSDTIYVLPYRYVKYFGAKGYLMDLTDIFRDSESLFYPEIWELGTVNETTYGIPWLGHSMCLLYNKDLLDRAGVDPESIDSPDSLLTAMELVEEKTDANGIGLVGAQSNDVSWMVNQFIYGYGSSLVNDEGTAVVINNEKSKAALDFYKNALGKHAQPTWVQDNGEDVMVYFRNQEVAFEIQGIWGATDIQKNGSPFEVGIISLEDVGLCSEVGPMMLGMPKNMSPDKADSAIQFIRYLISTQAQEEIMNGEYSPEHDAYYPFRTPIRIDMANSQIFQSYPEYFTFIEGFQNPSIDVPVPAWQTIKDELYQSGLHKVMDDEMTIDDFLNMIETQGNAILKEK
jgi:multiple sugar transport system substrate-binding protein